MKPVKFSLSKRLRGFTLLETTIGIVLGSLLLAALYQVFFKYIGVTQKGEDYLTSVRDAMITLEDLRKEFKAASEVVIPDPVESKDSEKIDLSKPSQELRLKGANGLISYTLNRNAQNQAYLEKAYWEGDKKLKQSSFHISRLNDFEVFWVHQKQIPGNSYFTTKSIFVNLEIQGTIGTVSGAKVKVGTVITPFFNTAENSSWP